MSEKMDAEFKEHFSAQDRKMVMGILHHTRTRIQMMRKELEHTLKQRETEMDDFASKTLTNSLKEGLEGKASDAAQTYLKAKANKVELQNPIKYIV